MTKSRILALWLGSLILLLIAAGQSWRTFQISDDAGGGDILVTGFQAFPVIGTLIALQVVAVLVSLLVRPMATRFIALAITPFMLWNLFDILQNSANQVQISFVSLLAMQTGVKTDGANSEFLLVSEGSIFPIVFAVFLALNVAVLVFISIKAPITKSQSKARVKRDLPEDLWSNQS